MIEKLKAKLRTKSFWVAIIGALTILFTRLGYADAATLAENIAEVVGSVLLVLGIAVSPSAVCKGAGAKTEESQADENFRADEEK